MSGLWDFLLRNPIIFLMILLWLLPLLGNVLSKVAKRAAEQQRRAQGGAMPDLSAPPDPLATAQPPERNRPDPEEIAAEIRRVMGLEEPKPTPPAEPEIIEDTWEPEFEPEPAPAPPLRPQQSAPHLADLGGGISHREISETHLISTYDTEHRGERAASRRREFGSLGGRRDGPALGSLGQTRMTGSARPKVVQRQRRLADLSDPARAFVLMEVFGPPKAMQDPSAGPG